MSTRSINLEFEINEEFITDILTIAAEGGINYWVAEAKCVIRSKTFECLAFEVKPQDSEIWYKVDPNSIFQGLQSIIAAKFVVNPDVKSCIREAIATNDASGLDADDVDCIVQAGLFGEIVYS